MHFRQAALGFLISLSILGVKAQASEEKISLFSNTTFQIRAGFSIGGSAPIPFPEEITHIEHYDPTLSLGLEANLTKWFDARKKWGIRTGLRVEGKGMKTDASVKNYYTEVIGDGGEKVSGNFTGKVQTTVKNSYFTIPVLLIHSLSDKWNIYAGPYFSSLVEKNFSGYVYDGYLRDGGPTGQKILFEGENKGPYDFSQDLNVFQWGMLAGGEWRLRKHLRLFGELSWGFNNLFKKDFKTISFDMHPIYLNIGFGYAF
ncbi:MAG: PorT family protein [Bacteroidales bacterium]|nr:PorT family protein [Bacteroidales bacterium]